MSKVGNIEFLYVKPIEDCLYGFLKTVNNAKLLSEEVFTKMICIYQNSFNNIGIRNIYTTSNTDFKTVLPMRVRKRSHRHCVREVLLVLFVSHFVFFILNDTNYSLVT